jgi:hypothetical protein
MDTIGTMRRPLAHMLLLAVAAALAAAGLQPAAAQYAGQSLPEAPAGLPADVCAGKPDGRLPHPSNCSSFVVCYQGALRGVQACPPCGSLPSSPTCAGLTHKVFDTATQSCVW